MDVRLPDGTVVTNVPDGMTQGELMRRVEGKAPTTPQPTTDQTRAKLAQGASLRIGPLDTGIGLPQGLTEALAGMGRRFTDIGTLGMGRSNDAGAQVANKALDASGYATAGSAGADLATMIGGGSLLRGGGMALGQIAPKIGSAIGTAGQALMAPQSIGQAATAGALYGGATTPGDLFERGKNAAVQGVMGGLGQGLMQGIGKVISPAGNEAANTLRAAGVDNLTPGMALGPKANIAEQKLMSAPLVGPKIAAARTRAIESFNVASVNEALAPIGATVPKDVTAGRELINKASNILEDAYGQIVPDLLVKRRGLSPALNEARQIAAEGDKVGQFDTILKNKLFSRFDNLGNLTGKELKQAESQIKRAAAGYMSSPDADQRALGSALMTARDTMMEHAAKTSGAEKIAELAKVDSAYSNYLRIQTAAGGVGAKEGVFSPAQLTSAVRQMSGGLRKSQFAKGNAAMQDFSSAAEKAIGPSFPNSGTADRAGLLGLIATGMVNPAMSAKMIAGLLGGSAAYSQPGQKFMASAMSPRTSPLLLQLGRGAQQTGAPMAGLLGSSLSPALINAMQQ